MLFILGIKLYRRLGNYWKKYLIPVYPLTCCFLFLLARESYLANRPTNLINGSSTPWLSMLSEFALLTLVVTTVWAGLVYLFVQARRLWN